MFTGISGGEKLYTRVMLKNETAPFVVCDEMDRDLRPTDIFHINTT